jgi:hypothetical protein
MSLMCFNFIYSSSSTVSSSTGIGGSLELVITVRPRLSTRSTNYVRKLHTDGVRSYIYYGHILGTLATANYSRTFTMNFHFQK